MSGTSSGRITTIKSLAERLGLSVTTVSLALNGRGRQYGISDKTVAEIQAAAERFRYITSDSPRGRQRQRTGIIGVLFPHLRNNWAHDVMDGMCDPFEQERLLPFVANHRESSERESRQIDSLLQRRVTGIICNPLMESVDAYQRVISRGIPLVFLEDSLEQLPDVSFVAWDPEAVGVAVRHLLEVGCRRIGFIGMADNRRMTNARYRMYCRTLESAGLTPNPEWSIQMRPDERLDVRLPALFAPGRERPDAFFAMYDDCAMAAVEVLQSMGINIPGDVCIATLADSRVAGPRGYDLTTVKAPVVEEGRQAALLMIDLLRKSSSDTRKVLVPGGELIVRGSTSR